MLLLVKQWERLVVDQDILYRLVKDPVHGQFKQIVLPEMLKKQLWTSVHDQMGHQGIERTMALLCAQGVIGLRCLLKQRSI